ncbi:MAG TPA: metalloregulator ArsR/SmtB family transcription factor [Candidatus Paceibacterota bacterium]|nr:metalloregulator ArsR/SmtB family transcription factor [Candidatus Paceibacterota bacterium]
MSLQTLCKAIGNQERVQLVLCLAQEASVSELLGKCALGQSALSQHLAILREAGILRSRESGRNVYYRVASAKYLSLAKSIISLTH